MSSYAPVPVTRVVESRPGGVGEGDVSDLAPEFELIGSDGETHRLVDHRGLRAVVLAWFPKAYTPG